MTNKYVKMVRWGPVGLPFGTLGTLWAPIGLNWGSLWLPLASPGAQHFDFLAISGPKLFQMGSKPQFGSHLASFWFIFWCFYCFTKPHLAGSMKAFWNQTFPKGFTTTGQILKEWEGCEKSKCFGSRWPENESEWFGSRRSLFLRLFLSLSLSLSLSFFFFLSCNLASGLWPITASAGLAKRKQF